MRFSLRDDADVLMNRPLVTLLGDPQAVHCDGRALTVGVVPRILVDVHPGLRLGSLMVGDHEFFKPAPDEQIS
jgi:hypothetical protein